MNRPQPGLAIYIREGNALGHFIHIGRGMKIVSIVKRPTQFRRQAAPYRGFTRTRNTHRDDNHGFVSSVRPTWGFTAYVCRTEGTISRLNAASEGSFTSATAKRGSAY